MFREGVCEPAFFPPLSERDAQRALLGEFAAVWVSNLDDHESVVDALACVMEGRGGLLRQLLSHTSSEELRTLH